MTLSIAEDDAVFGALLLGKVNKRLNAPIPALVFPWVFGVLIGLLFLGSSAMFSSILSTTLVALGISYLIPSECIGAKDQAVADGPVITVAIQGRSKLLALRPQFSLGRVFGAVCYAVAIPWGLFTAVMFCFPATKAVNGSTMNYTAPVIGITLLLATINWFAFSSKKYAGPRR